MNPKTKGGLKKMKFRYKVWRSPDAGEGAFRVRLADGGVMGVMWTRAREQQLEQLFDQWAVEDTDQRRKLYWKDAERPLPKTPRP